MADLDHFVCETIDEHCPLLGTLEHECRSSDWVTLTAAGRPPLHPGGDCFEGACYAAHAEVALARTTAHMADRMAALLTAIRHPETAGDFEVAVTQAAVALGFYRAATNIAKEIGL